MFLELKNTDIGYKTPLIKGAQAGLDLGDIALIIGNNGVGKTTLIKSILNQIPLLDGEILIRNQNIKNLNSKDIAKLVAVVFSKSQIPQNYTTKDLISLGKYIHYPYYFELNEKDKAEIESLIEALDLTQYQNFPLTKLSDGNLQKAFIGRALAQNSPIIILDEPTTHLDEHNKLIILSLLRNLAKKQGKLILLSSHDWRLAKDFCDYIWFLKDQTLFSGLAEDIIAKHEELSYNKPAQNSYQFPKIVAPEYETAMLTSFLRKHLSRDFNAYLFQFSNGFWEISIENQETLKTNNWEDILKLIKSHSTTL